MTRKFHLAFIFNFTPDDWQGPFGTGGSPWDGRFHTEVAQALERACFDYVIVEDKLMVPESYGGSSEAALKQAMVVPKHDPVPLAVAMGLATRHLGIVATLSTLAYPPFMTARLASTMDSMLGGRFGWNIVTSAEDLAARNFGLEELPPREVRYEMADEYVDVVKQLFASWDPDAVVLDRDRGVYADHTKVRPIHFKGKHFSVRGPLNTVPSPQHRPAFVQAGASPRGRVFAARNADSIIAIASGVESMRQFREDVRRHAVDFGRDPDELKVLFCVTPVLGETEQDARDKQARMVSSPEFIQDILAQTSALTEIDFARFDLDEPLPYRLETNGEQGSLDKLQQWGSGKTLRELVIDGAGGLVSSVDLVGTPDQVAERMGEVMEEVGGDGFMLTTPLLRLNRRYIAEVADGLVPALQRRGLTRTAYTPGRTLRENLAEF
ncbi:NtaA/DmoA family FMN-dependent monooxygenase [Streptomyces subrutilus]|uniref:Dibenzothiophene desulfurization enzyme A n=1 Tax=Streptomyces subrutilus TaxID=36818 RepID=A0A5P2UXD0_9ACTN|nr:NtaA/DmoA family FMN-dependent monooxygenase [Streptomyces subrutilus]QEU82161.1 LLM class flavin-dependent oxidoreductase [Streptomyces subrutilus]WSJ28361.1 NtaA/DmoA family FMN-dependent monooxygenase [Streptomyces subrutilus]GGZ92502.1 dibenzothiophene desulfurization enzyme A [Streptomyces subrutilus]